MTSHRLANSLAMVDADRANRESIRATNPFATRWVRPGAIPYCFPENQSSASIVEQLQQHGWRGAIIGPHGSGKSTLLATLIPAIEQAGRRVCSISLHDGQRVLPPNALPRDSSGESVLVVVDGYEQLSRWTKIRLRNHCRRQRFGLLVTVHRKQSAGRLPIVFETSVDLAMVEDLVNRLLPEDREWIHPADVAAAFAQHSGNVRDTLFALYHLFEQRRADCGESPR